jgi:hypothetical protein
MPTVKPENFPSTENLARAKWAPILLSPIMGSPERFVIGVAAVGEQGFHIEQANALRRFECLYGKAAETAVFAAEVALDELKSDLAKRGKFALIEPSVSFSGVEVGPVADGEAPSVEAIACAWMASLSSLYNPNETLALMAGPADEIASAERAQYRDRLPSLVLEYVSGRRPEFVKFFNEDIRDQRRRRRRAKIHGVIIDFAGSHLVANLGTLIVGNPAASVDKIKRQILDLIVNRDREQGTIDTRLHEMIIHHPSRNDPQVTERQYSFVEETVSDLSDQASRENVGFRAMVNVPEIGDHLLNIELRV